MKTNKKQFDRWLQALYSEKFPKTTGALQNVKGYCCLGVGCKVLIPEDEQELNADSCLRGGLPIGQTNAPKWLKDINNDFKQKT